MSVLTPEEWREGEFTSHYGQREASIQVDHKGRLFATSEGMEQEQIVILNESYDVAALHKTAALCLANQPFGFTHADADAIDSVIELIADMLRDEGFDPDPSKVSPQGIPTLRSLAIRIRDLLPPIDPQADPMHR